MSNYYSYLFVVMCDDTGNDEMLPGVSAIFESRVKAEEYVDRMNADSTQHRYYIDTSFLNEFED